MIIEWMAASVLTLQSDPARDWDDVLGTEITEEWQSPVHRQYDFWLGEWDANWRGREEDGLDHVEDGSHTHQFVIPVLDGKAVMELMVPSELTSGVAQWRGFSLRYYDEENDRWIMAQHWPGPQNDGVAFLDQLTGNERFGRIAVYSPDLRRTTPDGEPQIRRYTFSDIREDAFRWDGANTADRGTSWFTWMAVDFRRLDAEVDMPPASEPLPGYNEGLLCSDEPHGALDGVIGAWSGTATSPDGTVEASRITAGQMLDGCGVMVAFERPESGYRSLTFWSWSPQLERWFALYLNNQSGQGHRYYSAATASEGASFNLNPGVAIVDAETPYINHAQDDLTDSLQRIGWLEISETELVFRVDWRSSANTEWQMSREYRVERD
ncbi:hypothetical protein [Hyphobacterium sp.]|uniref:hypothetical protein n=1 Tax=Hyphobacterium sp. TaxID=2004662 RepID=UPI003749D527